MSDKIALTSSAEFALSNETKSRQEEIWNKVTDAAKKYSDENGHVKFSNEVYIQLVENKFFVFANYLSPLFKYFHDVYYVSNRG